MGYCMQGLVTFVGRITGVLPFRYVVRLVSQTIGLLLFAPTPFLPLFPGCGLVSSDAGFWLPGPGLIAPVQLCGLHTADTEVSQRAGSYRTNTTFCWKRARALLYLLRTLATFGLLPGPRSVFVLKLKANMGRNFCNNNIFGEKFLKSCRVYCCTIKETLWVTLRSG